MTSGVGPGDLVLDLGAGDGAITCHLVRVGARVIAFELHPQRAARLRGRFADHRVKVVGADITDLRLPGRSFRVVANPPFDGVSAVLDRLTHPASRLERADLIVPRAVARRWQERLRRGSPWQLDVETSMPRSAFTPRPRIDVCHISIRPGSTR